MTVVINGTTGITVATAAAPAFSAAFSGTQSVTSNTLTKVTLNTESFDTNSNFDTSAYRFTPTVAGYYQFSYGVDGSGTIASVQAVNALLYKNGTSVSTGFVGGSFLYATAVNESTSTGSVLVYMNGSTDYVELYGKVIGTSPYFAQAFLTGFMARSA